MQLLLSTCFRLVQQHYIIMFMILWQSASILWRFWWKIPTGVKIVAYPTVLGRWLTALRMSFNSDEFIQRAYDQANGQPFAIPLTDRWIVYVSDANQIKKLDLEPDSVLSREQGLHEFGWTQQTLGHLRLPPDTSGPKSENFRVVNGVLKNKLRTELPALREHFKSIFKTALRSEFGISKTAQSDQIEWSRCWLMPTLFRIITRMNLSILVGEEQANQHTVVQDALSYLFCVSCTVLACQLLNKFCSFVIPITMGFGLSRSRVFKVFLLMTEQALNKRSLTDINLVRYSNITGWAVEMTKLKEATAIAKISFGVFFAGSFSVPLLIQACIYRMCMHPEYLTKLREEALEGRNLPLNVGNHEMPYLDSFIRETARLSPSLTLSSIRSVMHSYTSSDGYHIPKGNWIASPQSPIMRDENLIPRAKEFDGFRFLDKEMVSARARLTHPSQSFLFWGPAKNPCPGRFYVSVIVKELLSQLLLDYDFMLVDPTARPFWTIGKVRLASPFMSLLVRKRIVGPLVADDQNRSI
ncbi:cytochrome P450 [Periconia macrospinosa]|uniref:Cytochrome P450 n=1 Tax=Periconia macrospinosa TaxID=97972 RepID=A0A2V1DGR4_9PLEO|nr:cytochrome P450 [Periconia macrospinosa]